MAIDLDNLTPEQIRIFREEARKEDSAQQKSNRKNYADPPPGWTREQLKQMMDEEDRLAEENKISPTFLNNAPNWLQNASIYPRAIAGEGLNMARGMSNATNQLINMLPGISHLPEGIRNKFLGQINENQAGVNRIISPEERETTAGRFGNLTADILPWLIPVGQEAKLADFSSQHVPDILTKIGKAASIGALSAPAYLPDTNVKASLPIGFGLGGASEAVIPWALKSLRNFGGTHSAQEIAEAIASAPEGHGVPLGEAIGSPMAKKFQSLLTKIPGSGMAKAYQEMGNANLNRLHGTLEDLAPSEPGLGSRIQEELMNNYNKALDKRSEHYNKLMLHGNIVNQKISEDAYKNKAQEILNNITRIHEAKPEFREIAADPEMMNFLKAAVGKEKKGISYAGETYTPKKSLTDFDVSVLSDKELGNHIRSLREQISKGNDIGNNKFKVNILNQLQNSLRKDIEGSLKNPDMNITNQTNDSLYQKWLDAKKQYREEVVPFQTKKMMPFVTNNETKSPDQLIGNFIQKGGYEKPTLANQLLSKLTPQSRSAVARHYLTSGESKTNPNEIITQYKGLGPRMKDLLIPKKQQKDIEDSLKYSKLLGAQKDQMYIPKTGFDQAITALGLSSLIRPVGSAMGSVLGHPALGYALGIPSVYGGAAAAGSLSRKAMMSDMLRNMYLKSLEANSKINKAGKFTVPASTNLYRQATD